jgi:hypothetical protein
MAHCGDQTISCLNAVECNVCWRSVGVEVSCSYFATERESRAVSAGHMACHA